MLKHKYLLANVGIDTAENEPSDVWPVWLARTPLGQVNNHEVTTRGRMKCPSASGMCVSIDPPFLTFQPGMHEAAAFS